MAQYIKQINALTSESKLKSLLYNEFQKIENGNLTIVIQENQVIQFDIYQKYINSDYLVDTVNSDDKSKSSIDFFENLEELIKITHTIGFGSIAVTIEDSTIVLVERNEGKNYIKMQRLNY